MLEIKEWTNERDPRGLYKISEEIYFAQPQVSNSDLNQVKKSPKAYMYYKNFGGFKKTPQMELGSLVHSMYLEPHTVTSEFIMEPKMDKRTKLGKQMAEEFKEESKGKTIVSEEIWEKANTVVSNLNDNLGTIEELVPGKGMPEVSGFWELQGVACRGRFDYLVENGYIYDLKTTSDLLAFEKSVANFGYHRQAAFYGRGLAELTGKFKGFRFVVVETNEPYDSAVLELHIDSLKRGNQEIEIYLKELSTARADGVWQGAYDNKKIHEIRLPRWY